ESRPRRGDALPAGVRRRAGDAGEDHAARDQQGHIRRMSLLTSFREPPPPPVAVELAATRVSAAALEVRAGGAVVSAHASEPLPEGALVPSLTASNVRDRAAVAAALEKVFSKMGVRPRRVGLVIPDPVSKVSLVKFERVPPRRQDLDQLIRWQVKKTAPFPIEESQISYAPALAAAD